MIFSALRAHLARFPRDAAVHAKIWATAAYAVLTVPFWMGAALGLFAVGSLSSRLALTGFLVALTMPIAILWWRGRRVVVGIIWVAAAAALVGGPWWARSAELPVPTHSGPVAAFSVELGNGKSWGPWDALPEIDWIRAGTTAGAAFAVTPAQSRYLVESSTAFDDAMAADPDFAALPSQMPRAIDGLLGLPQRSGHYVLLTGTPQSPKRKGLVVFLHGSAANFRTYAWLMRDVVLKTGWDVVIPTYGFGDWNRPGGIPAIQAVLRDAYAKADYAETGAVFAGVSNGGRGLTRVVADADIPLKSVVFISPVMEPAVMETPEFAARAKGLPVTIIHGLEDDRIPASYVEHARKTLVAQGAVIRAVPFPQGDHFILFSQSGAILGEIEKAVTQK